MKSSTDDATHLRTKTTTTTTRRHQHRTQYLCYKTNFRRMSSLLLIYLIINICVHGISCFQRFSEQPRYTEVNPGQDALLTCKVIDKRGTCSWQKDNKPVGIHAKKYEWAARSSSGSGGLHLDLHPPPLQIGGDCSLWIRSATLDFDDGLWECQVTASDFTTQDALTSQPVRLVVRVVPQRPRLEYEGAHVPPGHNITIDSGAVATVKCVSHYGNPPATLKWYLGDQEIAPIHPQVNNTEADNLRTWSATSVVQITAMRERHGDILRCLAYHESYTAKSVPVEARLDVRYAPTIRLIGSPEIDLEEDKDTLVLRCVADANPPASIVWRRAGRSEIASLQETLQLRPVGRRDAGLYTCQAQNSVGTSEQLSVQLDVKYPPKIVSAGPDRLTTAPLFTPAAFECVADGNPMPTYKWVQRIAHGSKYIERGHDPRLVIDNVTYDYQGEYECRATSYINGQDRTAISDPISLQVVGAPQVLRLHPSMHAIVVKRGQPASLSLVVCADPRPHRVTWEWGSLRLEAGSGTDRFRADDVLQDSREDCYLSTLHIDHTEEHDSRPYYLVVENERGTDRHAVHLSVEEPLQMSYLMGIAGGCLAAILLLICLCVYMMRGRKCCFKGSAGYKSSDKDSEKADLKSRSDSTSGPQGDSIYTTPAGFHHQQQQQLQQQQHHHQNHQLTQSHHLQQQQQHHLGNSGIGGSPEAMKTTRPRSAIATTARETVQDDFGNLLWQQEATEFIEKYPIQRHQRANSQHTLLRPSASAGALNKNATAITTLNKRASGGELLSTQQRHQRDLFSGDLGIPEIRTHVGSVVHTFETMALQRQRQRQAAAAAGTQEKNQPLSKYMNSNALLQQQQQQPTQQQPQYCGTSNKKYHQLKRKSYESRHRIIQHSNSQQHLQNKQLQSALQQQQQQHHHLLTLPIKSLTGSSSTQTFAAHLANALLAFPNSIKQRSTLSLLQPLTEQTSNDFASSYGNIDEDYRKNLFGTLSTRKIPLRQHEQYKNAEINNSPQSNSGDIGVSGISALDADETIIVNEAFDKIFADYSGEEYDDEDDHEKDETQFQVGNSSTANDKIMVSISELDNDVFKSTSSNYINNLGRSGNTPKKFVRLSHKKGPPPPPPPQSFRNSSRNTAASTSPIKSPQNLCNQLKVRKIVPLAAQKQRSTTLTNLFDRLKSSQPKHTLSKIPSDSLIKNDELLNANTLHKFPAQIDLHREVEGAEATSYDGNEELDFLRGTTLSQSFVRHVNTNRSAQNQTHKAPPQPPPKPQKLSVKKSTSNSTAATGFSVSPLRGVLLIPKRSKSTNELFLDDLNVQVRKYYQAHKNNNKAGKEVIYGKSRVKDEKKVLKRWERFSISKDSAEI